MRRPPILLLAPLALALLAAATPAHQDPDSPRTWSTAQLLEACREARDQADPEWFEALGERADRKALAALEKVQLRLQRPETVELCSLAFRHFDGTPLEEEAITSLLDAALTTQDRRLARGHAAGLVAMGDGALDALRQVVAQVSDSEARQVAVGGLVGALRLQGDEAALRVLLDHYRPPLSGPHDLGVRTLGSFRGDWAVREMGEVLDQEHRPRQLRAMVAEALGATRSSRAEVYLMKGLKSDSSTVRRSCLVALGNLGTTSHRRQLKRLAKDEDSRVRKAVFHERLRLEFSGLKRLELLQDGIEDDDWAVRLAALEAVTRLRSAVGFDVVAACLDDPHPIVRSAAIETHLAWRRNESIPHLIALLDKDSQRLKLQAADALQLLTGLDLGKSARPWRQWWEREGRAARLPSLDEAQRAQAARLERRQNNPTQAAFYGIPLISDRVCFVLDTSGSMDAEVDTAGTTRLQAVQAELLRSLDHIPAGWRFNMVFFASGQDPYKKRLVEMTDRTRLEAQRFVNRQSPGGGTAIYDAIMLALADPDVDTLVVLSDGQPSGGSINDPVEILSRVQEAVELSQVTIHAISFNAPGGLLERLTKATGGEYREVD